MSERALPSMKGLCRRKWESGFSGRLVVQVAPRDACPDHGRRNALAIAGRILRSMPGRDENEDVVPRKGAMMGAVGT
ncbi:hypothetical protein M8R20_09615 [Pseudomonas sp. R2.Fl]|nr:hypothetical protein [Pseudomonas sp. R2.Fl]